MSSLQYDLEELTRPQEEECEEIAPPEQVVISEMEHLPTTFSDRTASRIILSGITLLLGAGQ